MLLYFQVFLESKTMLLDVYNIIQTNHKLFWRLVYIILQNDLAPSIVIFVINGSRSAKQWVGNGKCGVEQR